MSINTSFTSWFRRKPALYESKALESAYAVSDRQERIEGWDQDRIQKARIAMIGTGGIGAQFVIQAAMQGYEAVHAVDPDVCSPTDLPRQPWSRRDLFKPKADTICRIASQRSYLGTQLIPHEGYVQDANFKLESVDAVVCGVDDKRQDTRKFLSEECHRSRIPLVVMAVSRDALWAYCTIQEDAKACWNCIHKYELEEQHSDTGGCPGTPASLDILDTVVGFGLFGLSTLFTQRTRRWNHVVGDLKSGNFRAQKIPPRTDCRVCHGGSTGPPANN